MIINSILIMVVGIMVVGIKVVGIKVVVIRVVMKMVITTNKMESGESHLTENQGKLLMVKVR